jgi:DNA modification methylase
LAQGIEAMSIESVLANQLGWHIEVGDCLEVLRRMPDGVAQTCITSPPYFGLRDYGTAGQIGLEDTPEAFVAKMVEVFAEVRRVLRDDGTLWLNLGDSYSGSGVNDGTKSPGLSKAAQRSGPEARPGKSKQWSCPLKPKDLMGMPWRVALALQADGWWLRSDIIWAKPNPMPESVTDRPTKAHEYIFLMAKNQKYFYDADAVREPQKHPGEVNHGGGFRHDGSGAKRKGSGGTPGISQYNPLGRNKRTVWEIATHSFSGAHFATFPPALIEPCVLAGAPEGGVIIDPFNGAGTTGLVAVRNGRRYVGIELNPEYAQMARGRIRNDIPGEDRDVGDGKLQLGLFGAAS